MSLVVHLCDMYKLKGHPIFMAVEELMLDYRFQKIFNSSDDAGNYLHIIIKKIFIYLKT